MADIRCLICNRVNDASAERCWYCHSPLMGKQEGAGHDATNEEVPQWLAGTRELKEQDDQSSQHELPDSRNEDEVPVWLEHLRDNQHDQFDSDAQSALIDEDTNEKSAPAGAPKTLSQEDAQSPQLSTSSADDEMTKSRQRDRRDVEQSPNNIESPFPAPDSPFEQAVMPARDKNKKPDFLISVDDLPDWLSTEKDVLNKITSDTQKSEVQPSEKDGGKIEKGMLPAWLKSMRPLDVFSPGAADEETLDFAEEEGVLAGISGTLRPLDLSEREMNQPANPNELRVTDTQQKNAEILYSLLHSTAAGTKPSRSVTGKKGRNNPLRAIITIIMLLSVLLPFLFRAAPAVVPVLYPKEVVNTHEFIQQMPVDRPVLIAVQFEAGLAGELILTAEPVIAHLVSRGIPVALISTNVSGYAILEEQLKLAAASYASYSFDENVINLGYLPGGMIGLNSLVSDVRGAVPFSTDLKPAWKSTIIENVATFSDFGSVVLLTDNPEIVRIWVEQIGRAELPPPLIAIVSAQAAPLVQPYYQSGQLDGYIAGAAGALSYQLIHQVPGKASVTFNSYQLATLAAALLVFLGGLVSLAGSFSADAKKKGAS